MMRDEIRQALAALRPLARRAGWLLDPATAGRVLAARRLKARYYARLWPQAAAAIGASATPLGNGLIRIARDGRCTFVRHGEMMLDSPLMLEVMGDKVLTATLLEECGAPIPERCAFSADDPAPARAFLDRHGLIVVKPAGGTGGGRGVTTGIATRADLDAAIALAARSGSRLLAERQVEGHSVRLLFLGERFLDAVRRDPPVVTGDGNATIRELVRAENAARSAGAPFTALSLLALDRDAANTLRAAGRTPRDRPAAGERVRVKLAVNENAADGNVTVTEAVSPAIVEGCRALVGRLGVMLAGVDLYVRDLAGPFTPDNCLVGEVNTTPGLHHHELVADPARAGRVAERLLEAVLSGGPGCMRLPAFADAEPTAAGLTSPGLTSPGLASPGPASPGLASPGPASPDLDAPALPSLAPPSLAPPEPFDLAGLDASTPVLILGGRENALSLTRSLGRLGITVRVSGPSDCWGMHSRHCAQALPVPSGTPAAAFWGELLLGHGRAALAGSLLAPCSDDAIDFVARNRAALEPHYRFDHGRPELALALLDKSETLTLAARAGVATPRSWAATGEADLEAMRDALAFPVMVKPIISHEFYRVFGRKLFIVESGFDELAARLREVWAHAIPVMVVEMIPGPDSLLSSFYTYIDAEGAVLFRYTKRIIRRYPVNRGLACYHASQWLPETAAAGEAFFRGIGFTGLGNIEFKRDLRDGRLKVIESNARFTAAQELVIRSGAPIDLIWYCAATGQPGPRFTSYRQDLTYWYGLRDTLAFLELARSGRITVREWLGSLSPLRNVQPLHALSDPMPTLGAVTARLGRTLAMLR